MPRDLVLDAVAIGKRKERERLVLELDIVEAVGGLAEARIGSGGLDDRLDVRREPGLCDDGDGPLVADLTGGDGDGLALSNALNTLTKVFDVEMLDVKGKK